ncbi:Sodium channel voltage-gated type [Seminavis robusta]|uniref:Sodium channel voltage-gated type n=1 Tax=Seminavis robusta TaxID=568900 RepID=A0A9N8HX07_9STRA|nr:Sodium channel voltage-gated type [Seminavis robusta]|eukprot:Sro2097_g314320.1 Sodium channel voltage-gated type (368) ;mRNA; f:5133-6328
MESLKDELMEGGNANGQGKAETPPTETEVYGCRNRCGTFVNGLYVQAFVLSLIVVNAILTGLATFDFPNPTVNDVLDGISILILIVFTIEVFMQLVLHGWRFILNGWLVFEFAIVLLSWFFTGIQIFMTFRLLRASGVLSRMQVMKNLLSAISGAMSRLCAIGMILMVIGYVFAVMFTVLFRDLYKTGVTSQNYFGRLDNTCFTLFQIMTLDSWSNIAREVMVFHPWAWLPFVVFVSITGFVVLNLIVAVFCDTIVGLNTGCEKAKPEEEGGTQNVWVCWTDQDSGKVCRDKVRGLSVKADVSDLRVAFSEQHGIDVKSPALLKVLKNKDDSLELKASLAMKDLFVGTNEGLGQVEEMALHVVVPQK